MLSDVIERYGGKKMDPLDVYKDIFRIGEGFIQKEYEDSGILEETLIFLFFAIFFGCIIYFMPTRP